MYEIDHINGVVSDNRICNLRDIDRSGNQQNKSNTRGYSKDGNRYKAMITKDGTHIYLGMYATEQEARNAYLQAKSVLHIKGRLDENTNS